MFTFQRNTRDVEVEDCVVDKITHFNVVFNLVFNEMIKAKSLLFQNSQITEFFHRPTVSSTSLKINHISCSR